MRHPQTRILLPLLILALAAALAAAAETVTVEGVTHVRNGTQPRDGVENLQLRELWRAGGEDDEDVIFGVVTQVESDDAGNLYLLDTQLSQVLVFDESGTMTGTLSRQGDGPGEVRYPADMCFMPDGALGLMQSFPGKVTKVTLDDQPAGTMTPGSEADAGGFLMMRDINTAAGWLVGCGEKIQPFADQSGQTRTAFLSAFDDEGKRQHDYLSFSREWKWSDMVWDENSEYFVHYRKWDTGPDGRVYAASRRNEYYVEVWNADGTPLHVIERPYEPMPRTDEAKARVEQGMENLKRQFGGIPVTTKTEANEQTLISLFVHPDGDLWVLSGRGQFEPPEGVFSIYDVFTPEGVFRKQVHVHLDYDGEEDALMFARDGRVIVVTGFMSAVTALQGGAPASGEEEAAPMEVICYAVE